MLNYQDALLKGSTAGGERACEERWELLDEFIPRAGVLLDVGSNLGYFGLKAALMRPELAVVSLEADPSIARKQAKIIASHEIDRICVIQGEFSSQVSSAWTETCDWFDVTLLLSILHWLDDPAAVVRDLSAMSSRLIFEVPDSEDLGACGQEQLKGWKDPLEWARDVTGRECRVIGRASRHTSDKPSYLILVEGPLEKRPRLPYWGSEYSHPDGNRYALSFDGSELKLEVREQPVEPYIRGANLLNLTKLGRLIYPRPSHWMGEGARSIAAAPGHLDPLPHNMLWTASGIALIDGDDLKGELRGRAAIGCLRKVIRSWRSKEAGALQSYVPHPPAWKRELPDVAARTLRRLLPAFLWEQLRTFHLSRRPRA